MKVLICGAGFVNKGAEAMLRTVQVELAKRIPALETLVWQAPRQQCRLLRNSGFVPLPLPFESGKSIWRLLKGQLGHIPWYMTEIGRTCNPREIGYLFGRNRLFYRASGLYLDRVADDIDAVLDISGFAYGDTWGADVIQRRARPVVDYCERRGKPAFFLPQAWGSFETPLVKKAIRKLLSSQTVTFYSRDNTSSRHLANALERPEESVASWPDIVFGFRGGTAEQGEQILRSMGCSLKRPIVGIAPNMRVYKRVAGQGSGNHYVQALIKLVKHCLAKYDVDVVLQANEITDYSWHADDRYLCSLIAASLGNADRCFMTRALISAEDARAMIGRFEFLIGSRFHSLVFGLSQGVPAMSVSWSHKYRELFSLFGLEDSVQKFQNIDADALTATFDRGWSERRQRREIILEEAKHLRTRVDSLFDEIAARIQGKLAE